MSTYCQHALLAVRLSSLGDSCYLTQCFTVTLRADEAENAAERWQSMDEDAYKKAQGGELQTDFGAHYTWDCTDLRPSRPFCRQTICPRRSLRKGSTSRLLWPPVQPLLKCSKEPDLKGQLILKPTAGSCLPCWTMAPWSTRLLGLIVSMAFRGMNLNLCTRSPRRTLGGPISTLPPLHREWLHVSHR